MRPLALVPVLMLGFSIACAQGASSEPDSTEGALEVRTADLWAGMVTWRLERYGDPCAGDQKLDTEPLVYSSWGRERASVRNICFEVWKPGVTDRDNPDFWKELDVQAHFRFKGTNDWQQSYVNSVDRHGNNRRYAFGLDPAKDPFQIASTIGDVAVPFDISDEHASWATASANLEIYFTVNGQKLSASNDQPFTVRYEKTLSTPKLEEKAGGHVLHESIRCSDGLVLGSGAGYLAADVANQSAIDALGAQPNLLYGASTSTAGSGAARKLSVRFSEIRPVDGQSLPSYVDGAFASVKRASTTPDGDRITLMLSAYDRNAHARKELTYTFNGCQSVP